MESLILDQGYFCNLENHDKMKCLKRHIGFHLINIFFIGVFIILVIYQLKAWWAWTAFVALWINLAAHFGKRINIGAEQWIAMVFGLVVLEIFILSTT